MTTKKERIASLEIKVLALMDRVTALEKKPDGLKSYKEIQDDWYKQHSVTLPKQPPDIKHFEDKAPKITSHERSALGPAPYNKPSFCED